LGSKVNFGYRAIEKRLVDCLILGAEQAFGCGLAVAL
jgi:hypothetical protein